MSFRVAQVTLVRTAYRFGLYPVSRLDAFGFRMVWSAARGQT